MVRVIVDGIPVDVPPGSSALQACEAAGKEIPRFCYHERLSVAGNCRMCLVEVARAPKPVASCGFPVADGMEIFTDTQVVRRARRAVMEFLLINHPLDCPICDQGGECDLQDQAYGYGSGVSRYREDKRAVTDKDLGPLVKTVMTRCIQCTRCVRFSTEVAGTPELGLVSRGENAEITTYVEKALTSELSGNLIDVCPVGALTAKPSAFHARSWEYKKTDSIDVMDALGTNIQVQARGGEVMRIVPRVNDEVNEEWLSDKGRFSVDGLKKQRLDRPWVRVNGKLIAVPWKDALVALARRLDGVSGDRIGAIAGDLCDAESLCALKDLMTALGSVNLDCRQDGAWYDTTRRAGYLFNSDLTGIDQADALLIVGSTPRHEAPVLNARIRKRFVDAGRGGFPVGIIGAPRCDLTYDATVLGEGPETLTALLRGENPFADVLKNARRPMIILGHAALTRRDAPAVYAACRKLAEATGVVTEDWNGFNILHTAAARVGALDLGFLPGAHGRSASSMVRGGVDVLWLLGADDVPVERIPADTFVVYQGHHGDAAAARADIILPGAAYTEKPGTYVNTAGRVQRAFRAVFAPGEAREDWRIIRAFSEVVAHTLPYDTLEQLRERLVAVNPVFGMTGANVAQIPGSAVAAEASEAVAFDETPFRPVIRDYYQTNVISRASQTMAECSAVYGAAAAE
ncbi:NADH-quinone oxidoreductase subunit NuoG [Acetobacter peroxydans]|jgi:NADH-quinone oxidoreductase subunit G|uniref:NADH-quinone oxidoreductase subunit NuoG n=1 Tax=Acetobacter peroxydans TaxID=104098 RepID=UPI002357CEAB|nr:NADH-quinone oxidoreductase subunit NuoG [Acetobacter peroxydans]MCH4143878.1 NADH-quinone oxidoreductase subunit NuoG [Acetobacter peroxydans]MCI1395117.1 NADH-quinone oxidoreductase subunit NuoG [Acetobacter peroxydans]MCI1410785.1 NADH-quinone oxidoreductase subunit NuoG [Acetobacter peroxydans]MCI1566057.1 NADH-quinone oxidoreductase subunit NuoG [Acetobacter peroxydans]MCI1618220.1 NADH-quinone oxidoreductase subunit NuoG [Acetobacter peroxydans]